MSLTEYQPAALIAMSSLPHPPDGSGCMYDDVANDSRYLETNILLPRVGDTPIESPDDSSSGEMPHFSKWRTLDTHGGLSLLCLGPKYGR